MLGCEIPDFNPLSRPKAKAKSRCFLATKCVNLSDQAIKNIDVGRQIGANPPLNYTAAVQLRGGQRLGPDIRATVGRSLGRLAAPQG